jgi:hypothetical protein
MSAFDEGPQTNPRSRDTAPAVPSTIAASSISLPEVRCRTPPGKQAQYRFAGRIVSSG